MEVEVENVHIPAEVFGSLKSKRAGDEEDGEEGS